ncbi:acetate kinase [candidate division KSB3 bacterium]|uniref:Acetate kinase n=1 Tax=candidate division KSB3 bacterium TaxID=2044937 RepID=A0A2G6E482_9BACT|nr:MAG: acetate kinase [candidate division KSB3 bacterium]PIE29445.1 MAG: acetate kinase [candidate division KSB3 bacterium]
MKILVLNCGSSSLKYQLFDMEDESVLAKGLVERIGRHDAILTHRPSGKKQFRKVEAMLEHGAAIRTVIKALTSLEHGVIRDVRDIEAVGHRVVHGGEKLNRATLITDEIKKEIEKCIELAPLHNPAHMMGINAAKSAMPGIPQTAVFDTAFHATLPPHVYLYALPYVFYHRYKVRRYGFHGTSHKFVALRAAELMQKDIASLKLISCHIGNGASVTAVDGGKSVETSMGFTPLEGLVMGTRSGDIDPAIIPYVMGKEGITAAEVDAMLNKHSGLQGVTGLSSDMRDIQNAAAEGNVRAQQALDLYNHRLLKYIGAYAAVMNGVDAIVFTAGVGEHSYSLREELCQRLSYLGVDFDPEQNREGEDEREITRPGSRVKVWVIPTNEELMIARETVACCSESQAESSA